MPTIADAFYYFFQPPPLPMTRELPWISQLTPGASDAIREAMEAVHRSGYYSGVKDGIVAGVITVLSILAISWVRSIGLPHLLNPKA